MSSKAFAGTPRLLQQMQLLMENWRRNDEDSAVEGKIYNRETARAVLQLYTTAAGCYEPLLRQLHDFAFDLIDYLVNDRADAGVAVARVPGGAAAASVEQQLDAADKCTYAFRRVEDAERRMDGVVAEAKRRQEEADERIRSLEKEVGVLSEQLEFTIMRNRRVKENPDATRLDKDELDRERTIVELRMLLDAEKKCVDGLHDDVDRLHQRIADLKTLNGKYARQAVELAARVRVYNEHNDKFATLLSLQHDEKIATDKENELLRAELMDLNRFHQLRDNLEAESGTVTQGIDIRAIRHGRGCNSTVPRHLHFTGLMNRITMPREAAQTMVNDILVQRHSSTNSRMDFPAYIHAYMTKKHGADGVAWAYSLDEATQFYDSDVNLALFGLVSRRSLPEQLYRDVVVDTQMFVEGCELMDRMQHGEARMTVPLPHIVGLLVEMFPGYPDGAFRRLCDNLQSTLASNGQAHYPMLFPNMEREEVQNADSAFSAVEVRRENHFSTAFKELILDDAAVSMQMIEDALMHLQQEKVSMSDIKHTITQLFTAEAVGKEVVAAVRKVVLEHLGSAGNYEVTLPKATALSVIRTKAVVRKGIFRHDSWSSSAARLKPLVQHAAGKGEAASIVMNSLVPIDYRDVLQHVTVRRTSHYNPDDDVPDAEEEHEEGHTPDAGDLAPDGTAADSPPAN